MLHRKKCKTPGCKGLTYNSSGYCDQCQARYKRNYEQVRKDSPSFPDRKMLHEKGYDTYAWKEFSRQYLIKHPVCAICGAKAEICDHKEVTARQMIDAYGSFVLDENLYQPLCRSCNTRKAKQDYNRDREYFKQKEEIEGVLEIF